MFMRSSPAHHRRPRPPRRAGRCLLRRRSEGEMMPRAAASVISGTDKGVETMAYEGMIAETISIHGDKNEPISA
jgi:hypothetical protein